MSIEATNHVFKHTPYPPAQSYILLAIADVVNDTHAHRFFLGVPKLAQKTKCSERTIQRALTQFVNDGWLTVVVDGGGRGNATEYQFNFLKGDNLTETERVTPVTLKGDKPGMQRVTNEVSIHLLELNRTQGTQVEQSSPDISEICFYLAKAIELRGLKPRPREDYINGSRWRSEARLLLAGKLGHGDTLEASGSLSVAQIKAAIDYAMNDSFWATNILSPASLRKQYPTLRMQAKISQEKKKPKGLSAIMLIREEESRKEFQNAIQG